MTMRALAVRRRTHRVRRSAAAALVVLALGTLFAVHHSAIADEMHHGGMGTVIELCLGVFTAVGAGVAAAGLGMRQLGRWVALRLPLPPGAVVARRLKFEPRAGPPGQPLLCVWRR